MVTAKSLSVRIQEFTDARGSAQAISLLAMANAKQFARPVQVQADVLLAGFVNSLRSISKLHHRTNKWFSHTATHHVGMRSFVVREGPERKHCRLMRNIFNTSDSDATGDVLYQLGCGDHLEAQRTLAPARHLLVHIVLHRHGVRNSKAKGLLGFGVLRIYD